MRMSQDTFASASRGYGGTNIGMHLDCLRGGGLPPYYLVGVHRRGEKCDHVLVDTGEEVIG